MMKLKQLPALLTLLAVLPLRAQTPGESPLKVYGEAQGKAIPISLGGFNGEAYEVLKFDLEVAGCKVVSSNTAAFHVFGSNDAKLTGFLVASAGPGLTVGAGQNLLAKAYAGAPVRALAHAFSDDVVEKLTGKRGIAQTRIAFKANFGRFGEIYLSDYDGANAIPVTRDHAIVAAPAWAPGHAKLYYTSYMMANFPFIYAHTLATGQREAVSRFAGINTSAAISPDGSRMAMILSKNGSPEVYVADAQGRNPRQVTFTREGASSPCWSPDGQWICYTSREAGPAQLYRVPAAGGAAQRIATIGAPNTTEPDWSPDGKTLVFTSQVGGGFQIFTVPAAGGSAEFMCAGEDPCWARNSRTVIFAKRRADQSYSLQLLDVPTKQVKLIPLPLGNCSQPAWAR